MPRPGKPKEEKEEEMKNKQEGSTSVEESKNEKKDEATWLSEDKSRETARFSSGEAVKEEKGPAKEFQQELYEGHDIAGNEHDSVLRRLQEAFHYVNSEQGCGFYNKGFPCFPSLNHLFWRKKYRIVDPHQRPHADTWRAETEGIVMDECVLRRPGEEIDEFRTLES